MLSFSRDQSVTITISLGASAQQDLIQETFKIQANCTRPTISMFRKIKKWIREGSISLTLDSNTLVSRIGEMTASMTKPISRAMMSDSETDRPMTALDNSSREAEIGLAIEEMLAMVEEARAVGIIAKAGVVEMRVESVVVEIGI